MTHQKITDTFSLGRENKQDILTPPEVREALLRIWPRIALDPCGHPDSVVGADAQILRPENGLEAEWPAYTYINPPFRELKAWLLKALECKGPWCMLAPVRTHRPWFWHDGLTYLFIDGKFKFIGYDSPFPAPLCFIGCGITRLVLEGNGSILRRI